MIDDCLLPSHFCLTKQNRFLTQNKFERIQQIRRDFWDLMWFEKKTDLWPKIFGPFNFGASCWNWQRGNFFARISRISWNLYKFVCAFCLSRGVRKLQEMKLSIGPLKIQFAHYQPNQFKGWADTAVSFPVAYEVHTLALQPMRLFSKSKHLTAIMPVPNVRVWKQGGKAAEVGSRQEQPRLASRSWHAEATYTEISALLHHLVFNHVLIDNPNLLFFLLTPLRRLMQAYFTDEDLQENPKNNLSKNSNDETN